MSTQLVKNSQRKLNYNRDLDAAEVFTKVTKKVGAPMLAISNHNPELARALANIFLNQPETHPHFLGGALFLSTCDLNIGTVEDTVSMLYDLDTPVKLTWSAKRWRLEHELAGRRATAKRLTEAAQSYEETISKFATLANGIEIRKAAIKTSSQLGHHGMDMRHCVAAYHDDVLSGNTLLLSVEECEVPYTIALKVSSSGEVYMSQIAGVMNAQAPQALRTKYAKLFGAKEMPNYTMGCTNNESLIPSYLRDEDFYSAIEACMEFLDKLRGDSIATIDAHYSGGGDSGYMNDLSITTKNGLHITVDQNGADNKVGNGEFVASGKSTGCERLTFKPDWSFWSDMEDLAELASWDWYNNDGGTVEIELERDTKLLHVDGCYYVMEQEPQSGLEFDLSNPQTYTSGAQR